MTRHKIITGTLFAMALSVITSNAAIITKPDTPQAPTACETQIWPNISGDCLLTLDGKQVDMKVRFVTLYN